MSRHAGKIVLNGATSQADRWLPALRDGYANVDDRSLSDLLAFSVEFGRLIRFYDLDDRPDGDWSGFFAADPAIVLACIAALRPDHAERAFLELQRQTLDARHFAAKFERLTLMFDSVVQLARLANQWLEGLGPQPSSPTARLLRTQLVTAIEASLGPQLRRLVSYAEGAGQTDALGQPVPLDLEGFLPIWRLNHECPDASIYRGASRNRRIDHACPTIHALFTQCLDTLGNLQAVRTASSTPRLKALTIRRRRHFTLPSPNCSRPHRTPSTRCPPATSISTITTCCARIIARRSRTAPISPSCSPTTKA